jgi:hypothetical protein
MHWLVCSSAILKGLEKTTIGGAVVIRGQMHGELPAE